MIQCDHNKSKKKEAKMEENFLSLIVRSNFEIVECNFDDLEKKLKEKIAEQYDIVVTEDSVKEAKKIKAELNKGKKALEQVWKDKKAEMEAPIKTLNERAKQVFALCDEASEKINIQICKFEETKKRMAVTLCEGYKNQVCELKGIDPNSIDVSSFSNLGYVTEKGALSSSGKQAVDNLILAKVAEIAEQKQREAEAQMEIERIKQQAREELLQQQQAKAQAQEQVQEAKEEAQQTQAQVQSNDDGVARFKIDVELAIQTKGIYTEELRQKVQDWARKEIEKNATLAQAIIKVEARKA